MARIYDWGAREAQRLVTVAELRAVKGTGRRYAQVAAETAEEAAAAEDAGIEMVVTRARSVEVVRRAGRGLFITAALGFADAVTKDDILRTAFRALTDGADAVITARGLDTVACLAAEDIPVMGHLELVPRKSTWVGSLRAFGKTAAEALELHRRFQRLEEAGAFAVEAELVPARVMAEINRRTGLVTVSLGSGGAADVLFLFTTDICGEEGRHPRHARVYGDLASLQKRMRQERRDALAAFRADVVSGGFPGPQETAQIGDGEFESFISALDRRS